MFNSGVKYGLLAITVMCVSACSSPKLQGFTDPRVVERIEVIQAQKDCINARMKPVIQTLPQKTEHGTIMLPVAVSCEAYNSRP